MKVKIVMNNIKNKNKNNSIKVYNHKVLYK